jgi:formylglycine-generating enzyme required for sulfatase activity
MDLSASLLRGSPSPRKEWFFYGTPGNLWAARVGNYKLVYESFDSVGRDNLSADVTRETLRLSDRGYGNHVVHDPPLLFDLSTDISERRNVASEHPDVIASIQKQVDSHRHALEIRVAESKKKAVRACVSADRSEVHIPGGTFWMGSREHGEEEGPVRQVKVESFSIDRFDVTNAQFAAFVAATGYVTDAERKPRPQDYPEIPRAELTAGGAVFKPHADGAPSEHDMDWWGFVKGASWLHPYGPNSSIIGRENEPVVQVSYNDALAFAKWARRELPTEEQYEYAARGGLESKTYAWGDELTPGGQWMANVWQGHFPDQNSSEDGYSGLAPVACFAPNGYGLYDMVGNVWKWTTSQYSPQQLSAAKPISRIERVIKGGSFMCSSNYCQRFRPAARQAQESSFSSMHLGFRTVSGSRPKR